MIQIRLLPSSIQIVQLISDEDGNKVMTLPNIDLWCSRAIKKLIRKILEVISEYRLKTKLVKIHHTRYIAMYWYKWLNLTAI
jgi:hypothetical protein